MPSASRRCAVICCNRYKIAARKPLPQESLLPSA
jgi:hypothetical protein